MASDDKDIYELSFLKEAGKKKGETVETNVINDELIKKYIKEYNLENKIFGMDDMPFSELLELRLSFSSILKIKNLRGFKLLKKLCLDNNIIGRIEGLDDLPNLEWLDLSFNNIKIVEGLDRLKNLTDLSLFHNLIEKIDGGLDECLKLNILSIGDNQIKYRDPTISYLKKFNNLQVLKLDGNEMWLDPNNKTYVMAYLPQLKYLDYILIDQAEVAKAKEIHLEDLQSKENQGQPDDIEKQQAEEKRLADLDRALILHTDEATKKLKELNDDDDNKIKVLPDQADIFNRFYDKFKDNMTAFQDKIIKLNENRLQSISKFEQSVAKAEEENEKGDIAHINTYEKLEKQKIRLSELSEIEENEEHPLHELYPKIDEIENILIERELQLVERINEAILRFEKTLKAVIETIKDESKNFHEEMTKDVIIYIKEIEEKKDEQIKAFNSENPNLDSFTEEQKAVYAERDVLNTAISGLADDYKEIVTNIDDDTGKAYDEDLENFIINFKDEKYKRNQTHIREIMEFVEEKRKKIAYIIENSS